MDKAIQDNKELRDEELYALLDKAWEAEPRLCVSEELIQKTLKRTAEETDTKVVSFETAKKRRISPVKYIGVAVAALFVAVVGVNAFGNGRFVAKDAQMEAAPGDAAKADGVVAYQSEASTAMVNSADGQENEWYSSRSGHDEASDVGPDILIEGLKDNAVTAPEEEVATDAVEMSAMTTTFSQMLAGVLKDAGFSPVSDVAECWEFAVTETDWERELLNSLAAGEFWGNHCPEDGAYCYILLGKDGSRYVMEYNEPLDMIIRIETENGALWGLLGEGSFFFAE